MKYDILFQAETIALRTTLELVIESRYKWLNIYTGTDNLPVIHFLLNIETTYNLIKE